MFYSDNLKLNSTSSSSLDYSTNDEYKRREEDDRSINVPIGGAGNRVPTDSLEFTAKTSCKKEGHELDEQFNKEMESLIPGWASMSSNDKIKALSEFVKQLNSKSPEEQDKFRAEFKTKTGREFPDGKPQLNQGNPFNFAVKSKYIKEIEKATLQELSIAEGEAYKKMNDEQKAKFLEEYFKKSLTSQELEKYNHSNNLDSKGMIIADKLFERSEIFKKMTKKEQQEYISAKTPQKQTTRILETFKSTLSEKELAKFSECKTEEEQANFIQNKTNNKTGWMNRAFRSIGIQKDFASKSESEKIDIIAQDLSKYPPEEIGEILESKYGAYLLNGENRKLILESVSNLQNQKSIEAGFKSWIASADSHDDFKKEVVNKTFENKEKLGFDGTIGVVKTALDYTSDEVAQHTANTMAKDDDKAIIEKVVGDYCTLKDGRVVCMLAESAHLAKENEKYMFEATVATGMKEVEQIHAKNLDLYEEENRQGFVDRLKQSKHEEIQKNIQNYIKEHPEYSAQNKPSEVKTSSSAPSSNSSPVGASAGTISAPNNTSVPPVIVNNSTTPKSLSGEELRVNELRKAFIDEPTITGKIQIAVEMNRPDWIEKIVERLSDSQKSKLLDKMSSLPSGVKKDILAVMDRTNPSLEMAQKIKKIKSELDKDFSVAQTKA